MNATGSGGRHIYPDEPPPQHSAGGIYLLALFAGVIIGVVVFILTGQATRPAHQPDPVHSLRQGTVATCAGGETRCSRQ